MTLFHWSPAYRRLAIAENGLVPGSPRVVHSQEFDVLCFGRSPSEAWMLSGDVAATNIHRWDLWEVRLDDDDAPVELEGPPFEVRVSRTIPPERLWRVGTRER